MINRAINLALKSKRKQRHSCLILKHGSLIAQASNNKGHAEQVALGLDVQVLGPPFPIKKDFTFKISGKINRKLRGCTLISLRIKPDGQLGNSKPCERCEIAITSTNIRKVIYFARGAWKEEIR